MAEMSGISKEAWMRSCVRMAEAPAFWAATASELGAGAPAAARLVGMSLFKVSMIDSRWATCQGEIHTCSASGTWFWSWNPLGIASLGFYSQSVT